MDTASCQEEANPKLRRKRTDFAKEVDGPGKKDKKRETDPHRTVIGLSVGDGSAAGRKDGGDDDRKGGSKYIGGHSQSSSRGRPSKQTPDGRRDRWRGCRVGEAKNPGPPNPGENPLPESKRLKTGPEFHITVLFLPDGEIGHLRRTTLTPKDTTDRVRYRWQALAPGKCRCF